MRTAKRRNVSTIKVKISVKSARNVAQNDKRIVRKGNDSRKRNRKRRDRRKMMMNIKKPAKETRRPTFRTKMSDAIASASLIRSWAPWRPLKSRRKSHRPNSLI